MSYTGTNTTPHDTCFKDFFGRKEFVLDFIKYYIPKKIKDHVDLSSIRFSVGEVMTGVAFEQIKKEVEREYYGKKDQWEREAEERGENKGKVENSQEMLISAIQNKFGIIKPKLAARIRSIKSTETLHSLFNQVFFVEDKKEFSKLVDEVFTDSE